MKIKEILKNKNFIYSERYINTFKKVANEVSSDYCAMQGKTSFILPYTRIPIKKGKLFLANPDRQTYNQIIPGDKINFFIHPEMINEVKPMNLKWNLEVEPTSSTRTVLPKNKKFMIKLHLNKRLSRYIRRLNSSSVKHSLQISSEIEEASKNCPKTFGFLPETIGAVYNGVGMIIREKIPRPTKKRRVIIPLFSLYSNDTKNKRDFPFFVQLVKMKNQSNPLKFFIEEIVNPLFANMAFFINNYGLLLEPHGQNVLIEFDRNFNIKRLIHRDFQSIYVDLDIRRRKKLATKFKKHIIGAECPKEVTYSLVYDQFVGEYVFDPFVKLISSKWKIPQRKIISKIKQKFSEHFDTSLFPKKCYYSMKKGMFKDNNTEFKKHNKKPRYRI